MGPELFNFNDQFRMQAGAGEPKDSNQISDELNTYNRDNTDSVEGEFRCKTCGRQTKKYAKNQCQTCYKKDKKFQKEGDYGHYSMQQSFVPPYQISSLFNQGMRQNLGPGYFPNQAQNHLMYQNHQSSSFMRTSALTKFEVEQSSNQSTIIPPQRVKTQQSLKQVNNTHSSATQEEPNPFACVQKENTVLQRANSSFHSAQTPTFFGRTVSMQTNEPTPFA